MISIYKWQLTQCNAVLLCVELYSYLTGVMFVEGKHVGYLKFGQVFMVVSPASIQPYKLRFGKPMTGGHQYIPFHCLAIDYDYLLYDE